MNAPDPIKLRQLDDLVDRTLQEFGIECFWNVRKNLAGAERARMVVDQLSKHGGVRGLMRADAIAKLLSDAGETQWR